MNDTGGGGQTLGPQELMGVLNAMREGLQVIDRQWRYVSLNDAAAAHGRRSRDELVGRTMMECYPGFEQTEVFQVMKRCMEQRVPASMQNQFTYPDGGVRSFELRMQPCDVGVVVLSIDVTDGRKLEEQLRHAQKMEAIGRLAGSVAHDFNNMLSVILSYSTMLLEDLKPVDPVRSDVEAIQKAGEKAATLTRQLLAFSRQQVMAPRVVDLNQLLRDSEQMLRRLLGADVELVTRSDKGAPALVVVDPSQMDQVVMNLVLNARDAMPKGGKITIEVRNVHLDERYAGEHYGVTPGPHVMLSVSDTGVGMDKETLNRIFEPFFTTKERGKGTGLGLSTVFGIVQQSGGNIWVYSEPGEGTTFRVHLPLAGGATALVEESVVPVTLSGTETVLLVEDQIEVQQVAREILRRYGYHVLEASNAGEALLVCEQHPRTIHLLLTDVVMPHMNGPDLADRLLQLRPELKVLFMSGYTERAAVQHGFIESGADYLQKPLVPDRLARRVREVLDSVVRRTQPPLSR